MTKDELDKILASGISKNCPPELIASREIDMLADIAFQLTRIADAMERQEAHIGFEDNVKLYTPEVTP